MEPLDELRAAVDAYDFREVHPNLRLGTASDRYAAWLGQIYPLDVWGERVDTRQRKTSRGTFEERTLPVASVDEYFLHFGVLEIDFTYYRPLTDPDGKPEHNHFTLDAYAEHAPPDALFLLKAPQQFFSRVLRRSRGGQVSYEDNPQYLDAEAYLRQFHNPALQILGDRLAGVIFEQEYGRVAESPAPEAFVAELERFFDALPADVQPHLEVRSPHLLTEPYFRFLQDRGLGFVFSHWQYLPPIREQWARCGQRFTAADGNVVARLLSPRGMSFEDAFAKAYPFEGPVPEWEEAPETQRMVLDAVALLYRAEADDATLNLVVNNRAYGNAPALAQRIARRVLDEEARRT
jgi:uncharacterized protein YecE (DUF72 family)